jgi:large subunit ribosomal protein L32e
LDCRKGRKGIIKMVDKRLLELRKQIKAKKPTFLRQEAHKISKLRNTWRQPKGCDSKMRKKFKSRRKQPSMGYSSPRKVRGLNREGLQNVLVSNIKGLELVNKETQSVLIAKIGKKKRFEILNACQKNGLHVSNVRDVQEKIKNITEELESRKKARKSKQVQKKAKEEVAKKTKKEEKKDKKEESKATETKKGEKSDKIKTLEKRQ